MKTFKIKGVNAYITLDKQSLEDFNIDSEFTGFTADYEYIARYFFNQSEYVGLNQSFEIEEVKPIQYESCIVCSK